MAKNPYAYKRMFVVEQTVAKGLGLETGGVKCLIESAPSGLADLLKLQHSFDILDVDNSLFSVRLRSRDN